MTELGIASYGVVGLSYAALSVLLIISWRGQRLGALVIVACVLSTLWGAVLAATAAGWPVPGILQFAADVLRTGVWLSFLAVLLRKAGISPAMVVAGNLVWVGVLLAGVTAKLAQTQFDSSVTMAAVLNPGGLLVALVGLVMIEQLQSNTPPETRRGINALTLGLGGIFAYDIFLYSQGILIGGVEETAWMARGAVNIAFVPFIAIAARRNPDWSLDIFVSRHVVFYSTSIAAVGLYLLLMSLAGYLLAMRGGSWGVAQFVFFVAATLVLVLQLFSSRLRARVRVFLNKHFFSNKYDYRQEWLRLISTLAGFEDSSTRQVVIKAVAQIVSSPGGVLWVLDDSQRYYRQMATWKYDTDLPDISLDDSLVRFIERSSWLVDLEEYKRQPELYGDLELPGWLRENSDAWLILPLITRQRLLGLAQLNRPENPPRLNYEDRDLLKTVGNHIAVHLDQERSDDLLAQARQFETYNRLTAFLMHDLNNLIAQLSLIVANAEKHKRNPAFVDDAMKTIANSVDRMKRVMVQLRRGQSETRLKLMLVKFAVSGAADQCAASRPEPTLKLGDGDASARVDAEQLTMVLTHLIRNAQDATPDDGEVTVSTHSADGNVMIRVADTGSGMSEAFIRDRLFKPFDSTKGTRSMGIGAYQAREFARRMGGDLEVDSTEGVGTTVTLSLPVPGDVRETRTEADALERPV